jgi:hypothetical protein
MQPTTAVRISVVASAVLSSALLSGCAGTPAEPIVERTSQMAVDYPSYDLPQLVGQADRIIEGTAVSTRDAVLYPTFEGTDPLLNPLSEASEEEQRAASLEGAIAVTEVELEATAVHKGEAGDHLTITQTGGVLDGVRYTTVQEPLLTPGSSYLLFLHEGERPALLGGGAGSYEAGDGGYLAMAAHAPVESFSPDELALLLAEDRSLAD